MIPELLETKGKNTKEYWEQVRRPEIQRLFEKWVYGVTPKEPLEEINAQILNTELLENGRVKKEEVLLELKRNGKVCGFRCRLFLPADLKKPAPAIIMLNPFSRNKKLDYPGKEMDHMPYDLITSQGYIGIHADVDELCADDPDLYQEGLWELYPGRAEDSWGAIGMWAFAGSRVVDYLQMRQDMNCDKLAVCGCSRAGKAALWCGAQDQRISLVISNVSGCTGAAITRGKTGEHVIDITTKFPHWLCKNYASFSHREEELPVDQHMLLALCAPRPLYVSSASEDVWADPHSEFLAAQMAEPAYKLYGKQGLKECEFPRENQPIKNGCVGYHNRQGVHGCRRYDWEQYLLFIKQYFK